MPLLIKAFLDLLYLLAVLRVCILASLQRRLSFLEEVSARVQVCRRLVLLVGGTAEDKGLELVVRRETSLCEET